VILNFANDTVTVATHDIIVETLSNLLDWHIARVDRIHARACTNLTHVMFLKLQYYRWHHKLDYIETATTPALALTPAPAPSGPAAQAQIPYETQRAVSQSMPLMKH
jgi:hypothetical protein